MADEKKLTAEAKEVQEQAAEEVKISETWAQDIIEDLDDWIESQGIYLRQ